MWHIRKFYFSNLPGSPLVDLCGRWRCSFTNEKSAQRRCKHCALAVKKI